MGGLGYSATATATGSKKKTQKSFSFNDGVRNRFPVPANYLQRGIYIYYIIFALILWIIWSAV